MLSVMLSTKSELPSRANRNGKCKGNRCVPAVFGKARGTHPDGLQQSGYQALIGSIRLVGSRNKKKTMNTCFGDTGAPVRSLSLPIGSTIHSESLPQLASRLRYRHYPYGFG